MTLQAKLDDYKAGFRKKVPQEKQDVMARATEDLKNSGILDKTIKVGVALPDATLTNQDGEAVALSALSQNGPLAISFFRGGWCPYCNIELKALGGAAQAYRDAGIGLVVISPQTVENNKKSHKDHGLDIDLLSDPDNAFAKQLGLAFKLPDDLKEIYLGFGLDLEKANGNDAWELPMPTRLVIDRAGKVQHVAVNPDYTQRPDPAETLEAAVSIAKKA